jgi:hypothetical protein
VTLADLDNLTDLFPLHNDLQVDLASLADGGYHSDSGSSPGGSSPGGSDISSVGSTSHFDFPDYNTPEVSELMEGDWLHAGLGLLTAA